MKKVNLVFIIALILLVSFMQIASAKVTEVNKFREAFYDENGNFQDTSNPVSDVNLIGFICADSSCSSFSGSLWNGDTLNSGNDKITLNYPATLQDHGYAIYIYKDGFIPFERSKVTWFGQGEAPTYTAHLSKKEACFSEIDSFNAYSSKGKINVEASIDAPIENAGPLDQIPSEIEDQYTTTVEANLVIYDSEGNIFHSETKSLSIKYSDTKDVSFSVNAAPGNYLVKIFTSLENEEKCLSFDKDTKQKEITVSELSFVKRDFSKQVVNTNEIIIVDLEVEITGGEDSYAIEEYLPHGWEVIDANGGETTEPLNLKWVVVQDAVDKTFTYTAKAPSTPGFYGFDGNYLFEGGTLKTTLGETDVEVFKPIECDKDKDGFDSNSIECGGIDCDDNDASINPDATEIICNNIDENCDGEILQGTDKDKDGYSLEGGLCGPIDCDDNNKNFFQILTGYKDNDNDHYGAGTLKDVCSGFDLPNGYSDNNDDCNDNNKNVNPGTQEICDNELDDNCNGQIDEGCFIDLFPSITLLSVNPTNGFIPLIVSFNCVAEGGNGDLTYSWNFGDSETSNAQNPTHTYDVEGDYEATCTVTDEDGDTDTGIVTIEAIKDTLEVTEITCFDTVVENNNQSCSVFVKNSLGMPVGNADVDVFYSDSSYFGNCNTDEITGGCSVKDMQDDIGNFTVFAKASKPFFIGDLDTYPRFSYEVLEEKFEIIDLKVFNDENFTNEDYDFYRGENLFVKFKVLDQSGNLTADMITKATLVSPPGGRVNLTEIKNSNGEYYYKLKPIPLTHGFLGDSQIFTFAFDFVDNSGGQAEVSLTIRNNLPFIQPKIPDQVVTVGKKEEINLGNYENDLEDSGDNLTWEIIDSGDNSTFELILNEKTLEIKGIKKGKDEITLRLSDLDNDFVEQVVEIEIKKKKSRSGGGGGGGTQIGFIEIFEDEPFEDGSVGGAIGFVDMPAEEIEEAEDGAFLSFVSSGTALFILFILLILITIIVMIILLMRS